MTGKMQSRHGRRALFAAAAISLATACSDSTEVVIPPPPVDPISVSVTPQNLDMQVGQTAQFTAQVSGGAEGTARTVNWTSSNNDVATVSGSGLVTAVAPGLATITATSTADASAAASAAVRVEDDPANAPISITIKSITTGATNVPVNTQNTFGQIDVTLNVDAPVGANFTVRTLVDGVERCSQAVSAGAADVLGDESQALQEIVCSIPTHEYDPETGEVTYPNGLHLITAEVVRANGNVVATPSTELVFNNANFINASFDAPNKENSVPSPRSLAIAGAQWHSGDLTFTLVPVNYNGPDQAVTSATVTLTSSGNGVTGLAGCVVPAGPTWDVATDPTVSSTDGGLGAAQFPGCAQASTSQQATFASPATVTFPANAAMAAANGGLRNVEDIFTIAISSVTAGGQAGPICINPNPNTNPQNGNCVGASNIAFPNGLRVDNLAPRLVALDHFRNPNNYFGPNSYLISHAAGNTACPTAPTATPWFELQRPCARTVDYGVGRQTEAANADFFAVVAATPTTELPANSAGDLTGNETPSRDSWKLKLTVQDAGENARTVYAMWTAGPPPTPAPTMFSATAAAANLGWGWDETPPTAERTAGPAHMAVNPDEADPVINPFAISYTDASTAPAGPSGFNTDPVWVRVERILPAGTTCHVPDTFAVIDCAVTEGRVQEDGSFPIPGSVPIDGYFRYDWFVVDAAGNPSGTESLWILEDVTPPTYSGMVGMPLAIQGAQPATFITDLADNIELGSLIPYTGFAGIYMGGPLEMIGDFGPDALTHSTTAQVTIDRFIRSIDTNDGAGLPTNTPQMATSISFDIRDIAGHLLRYVETPWPAGPNDGICPAGANTSSQNCTNRDDPIAAAVLAGAGGAPVAPQFSDLNAMNGLNGLHGLFTLAAPSVGAICNNAERNDCPADDTPLTTVLTATVTGPSGTFLTPFAEVRFYYQDSVGRWQYVGADVTADVSDDTVLSTRTFTYSVSMDATAPKIRPAGAAGTAITLIALGVNANGDALGSTPQVVTVHGN